MAEKTIQIGDRSVKVRELKMRTLRTIYALHEEDSLGPVLHILEGATNLKPADLDDMTGLELKQLADAVKEVNTPFLELLRTMNSPDLAEGLGKIIDGIFYAPFLRSSAPATDPPSGDTPTANF